MSFELRTYTFIDSLQPQLAQYIAKDNRVYDPSEYDSALMLEIAPAMEIHTMIDLVLKRTRVRLGSVVTERIYGLMQIHHPDQGEVRQAGEVVLEASGLTEADRSEVKLVTNKTIRSVEQDHAISFTGMGKGNMIIAGESVLIMETSPAAYLTVVCNEALKTANIRLNMVRPFGATGRLIMSGPEAEIDYAEDAAVKTINNINQNAKKAAAK